MPPYKRRQSRRRSTAAATARTALSAWVMKCSTGRRRTPPRRPSTSGGNVCTTLPSSTLRTRTAGGPPRPLRVGADIQSRRRSRRRKPRAEEKDLGVGTRGPIFDSGHSPCRRRDSRGLRRGCWRVRAPLTWRRVKCLRDRKMMIFECGFRVADLSFALLAWPGSARGSTKNGRLSGRLASGPHAPRTSSMMLM